MKHLKLFENVNKPDVGNYIIDFQNDIGLIISVNHSSLTDYKIKHIKGSWVGGTTIVKDDTYDYYLEDEDIKNFGTREEMELIYHTNKYNI